MLETPPTRTLVEHGRVSWEIVEAILGARGKADFYDLAVAVRGHESGDATAQGSQNFVSYCIRSGWLRRAD